MVGLVKFAKKMITLSGNDRDRGSYEEYEFLDYKIMFAGHLPLTYKKFSNLLISDGVKEDEFDESECQIELNRSQLDKDVSPSVIQFYMSIPGLDYKIENIESLPFVAKGSSLSKLGDEYMVTIHPEPTEISDHGIKQVLKSVVTNKSYNPFHLSQLYRNKYSEWVEPSEGQVRSLFERNLGHICDYLGLSIRRGEPLNLKDSPVVPEGANFEETVFPDLVIYDQGRMVCIIEMKQPGLFDIEERPNPPLSALSSGNMEGIMKQLQLYMITASLRFGAVCDGNHLILAEFEENFSYEKYQESETVKPTLRDSENLSIPFKTKILNLNSSCPTFLEGLIYILEKAKNSDATEFYRRLPAPLVLDYKETSRKRRRSDPGIVQFNFSVLNSGAKLLQRSKDHITTVYKVKAKFVKEVILDNIGDDEYVIVKIYDPYVPHSLNMKRNDIDTQDAVRECYVREWNAVQTLFGVKDYNNIYLSHEQIEVHCFRGAGPVIVGNCIISRYIDSTEIPMTLDVYEEAEKQLQVIIDSGITHGDIKLNNLLFKDRIYVYDFSHSSLQEDLDPDEKKQLIDEDFELLDDAFYKVLDV